MSLPNPKNLHDEPDRLSVSVPRMFRVEATGRGIDQVVKVLPVLVFAGIMGAVLLGGLGFAIFRALL